MPLAAAGIAAGGSLLGGITSGKGAAKAAKINAAAYQKGIDEQNREFGVVQANNAPYMAAGTTGLNAMLNLLGLGSSGTAGQQSAIDALKTGPQYTSEMSSGVDALNQSLAASGGVRGGNGALSESTLGSTILNNLIQQSIGNYGSLVGTGQSAASGTNGAALSTGNNISNLLGEQGKAQGAVAAAPYAYIGQALSGLGSSFGNYLGSGGSGSGGSLLGQPDEVWNDAYGWSKEGW